MDAVGVEEADWGKVSFVATKKKIQSADALFTYFVHMLVRWLRLRNREVHQKYGRG